MKRKVILSMIMALSLISNTAVSGAGLMYGDADSSQTLTSQDAAKVLQYVLDVNAVPMNDEELIKSDVDFNDKLTSNDAALILQKVLNGSFEFTKNETESTTATTEATTKAVTETTTETTTEATTKATTETTTEATTKATTEATTETTTEETTKDNEDVTAVGTYIGLADGNTKLYSYENGVVGDEVASSSAVAIDGDIITINEAGTYYMSGTLTNGQIVVSDTLTKSDIVEIYMLGVDVTNSAAAPFNGGGGKIKVYLADGTVNTFTDNSTDVYTGYTTTDEPKGAFYSDKDLTIDESGTLVVNGNYSNGLVCGADITVKGGANITVNAVKNGIKGDNSVSFGKKTGTITVTTASGDGIKSDAVNKAKYYTSDGTQLSTKVAGIEADKGYVEIKGGTFVINAGGDGIQADNYFTMSAGDVNITAAGKGIKANEALVNIVAEGDDGNDYLTYNTDGSEAVISSHIDISGGTVNIVSDEDGIRACENLNISGGDITVEAKTAADGTASDAVQVGENTDTSTTNSDGSTIVTKTITVRGTMTVSGGTVTVKGAADDAIVSNGDFIMTDGTISGTSSCDFLKVYDNINISGGSLDITPVGDAIQAGKALTTVTASNGTETDSDYTEGNITISGGTFNIVANKGTSNTAITANSDSCKGIKSTKYINISGGDFNINSADDCIHSDYNVTITGGNFELATLDDGVHAEYMLTLGDKSGSEKDFTLNVTNSYEGIEGSVIHINSGTTYVYSTDDGINAAGDYDVNGVYHESASGGSSFGQFGPGGGGGADSSSSNGMIYIDGGYVFVEAPNGDGLDSNGSLEMTDGVVIICGPGHSAGNDVFDKGDGSNCYFKVTGGTLIGEGYNMAGNPSVTVSGQGYALSSSGSSGGFGGFGGPGQQSGSDTALGSAGNAVKVTTDNGNVVFIPKLNWAYMFISTPDMSANGSYTISQVNSYSGGTQVLGKTENGTFYGLVTNAD